MSENISAGLGYIFTNINLWQDIKSEESLNDVLITVTSIAGESVSRSLVPTLNIIKVFDVVHSPLTTIQKEWVENFYSVNRDNTFYFKWKADDLVYRVMFTKPPKFSILITDNWKAEFTLIQVNLDDEVYEDLNDTVGPSNTSSSLLVLLDIPLVEDADSTYGFYWAVTPTEAGAYNSATLYRGDNLGENYAPIASTTLNSTIGICSNILPAYTGLNTFDDINRIMVTIFNPNNDKVLTAASELSVLGGTNLVSLGSELIGFKSVLPTGNNGYILSDLLRGRKGTEWAMSTHVANEYLVLVDNNINRHTNTCGFVNWPHTFKAHINNTNIYSNIVNFTDTGISGTPLSPVSLVCGKGASSSHILSWKRRARINAEWQDSVDVPLDETTERYHIRVYNNISHSLVLYNYTATGATTITLTSAQVAGAVDGDGRIYVSVAQMTDPGDCISEGYLTFGQTL